MVVSRLFVDLDHNGCRKLASSQFRTLDVRRSTEHLRTLVPCGARIYSACRSCRKYHRSSPQQSRLYYPSVPFHQLKNLHEAVSDEWIVACDVASVAANDVVRFDSPDETFAIIKLSVGRCSIIDGLCTHGKAHLAEGFVDGTTIECPKHNGRFNVLTGEPVASPVGLRQPSTRRVSTATRLNF